jgi:serine protease AprX
LKGRVKITKKLILLIVVTLVFSASLFLTFSQQPLTRNPLTIPSQQLSTTITTSNANPKMGTHLQYLMQTSDPSEEYEMIIFFEKTVNVTQGISLLETLGEFEIISNYTLINGICIRAPIGMAETIAQQNYVRSITYNEKIQLPPDQITTSEIHIQDTQANERIGADILQAPPFNLNGTGVVVAVIDTGINSHTYLSGDRIIYNQSFVPGENPTDNNGHGTAVAGIIGATGSDAKGVAPNVTFLNLKVLNAGGSGTLDWVLGGINEAVNNTSHPKADIISMSLGGAGSSYDDMCKAVNSAWINNDTIVVVAAGNSGGSWYGDTYYGPYYETISSPGLAANIITVGATGGPNYYSINYSSIAYFSSRGPTDDGRAKPDIVAPGRNLTVLDNDGQSIWPGFSGTSAATPVVSGAIALLLDEHSDVSWISPNTVKAAIMMTAEDLGENPFAQGAGQINITRAYQYLQDYYITGTNDTPPLVVTPIRALAYPMLLWDLIPTGVVLTLVVGNVSRTPVVNAYFNVSGNARAFTAVGCGVFPSLNDTQEYVSVNFVVPLGGYAHDFSGNLTLVNGSGVVLFTIPLALNDASFVDFPVLIPLWFTIMNYFRLENDKGNLLYTVVGLAALGAVAVVGLVLGMLDVRKLESLRRLAARNELLKLSTMLVKYCPYCGTKARARDYFCYNCGKQIRILPPQPYIPK